MAYLISVEPLEMSQSPHEAVFCSALCTTESAMRILWHLSERSMSEFEFGIAIVAIYFEHLPHEQKLIVLLLKPVRLLASFVNAIDDLIMRKQSDGAAILLTTHAIK